MLELLNNLTLMTPGAGLLHLKRIIENPAAFTSLMQMWNMRSLLPKKAIPIRTGEGPLFIRYLVCADQVIEAVWSASSLMKDVRFRNACLVFHDDGTLRRRHVAFLSNAFPDARIILRESSDPFVKSRVSTCVYELRSKHPFLIKLLDFALYGGSNAYLQVDTDVLFFESPNELFETCSNRSSRLRYNEDRSGAWPYCFHRDDNLSLANNLPKGFNAGLVFIPQGYVNVDRIEQNIKSIGEPQYAWTYEQTLLAMECIDQEYEPFSSEYDFMCSKFPNVVSEHFAGSSRMNMYKLGYPKLRDLLAQSDS